jgi:hypothetical protein
VAVEETKGFAQLFLRERERERRECGGVVGAREGKCRLGAALTRKRSEHCRDVALIVRRRCAASAASSKRTRTESVSASESVSTSLDYW